MPPKKDEKKKGPGASQQIPGQGPTITISEDDLSESKNLPQINDLIFFNLYAFKMNRNLTRLHQHISKLFTFNNPEEPGYTEEFALKYKTIEMYQIIAQAINRGLITEQEAIDINKVDPHKKRQVLAQATVESVTAFQLQLRHKRKEELADPQISQEKMDLINSKIDQIIFLKDFPKTADDVKAMIKFGLQKIHCGFLIEEIFSREIESDDEETQFNSQSTVGILQSISKSQYSSTQLPQEVEQDNKKTEKKINRLSERAQVFDEFIKINRIIKNQNNESELINYYVKKMKFTGPQNPLDIPPPPEEGQEPIPVDEELKTQQFKFYIDFSLNFKLEVENIAKQLLNFKQIKKIAQSNKAHLWPRPFDADEELRRQQKEEEQKKQQAEKAKQEEEERKAAEANQKGGVKKSANTKVRNSTMPSNLSKDQEEEVQVKTLDKTEVEVEESPIFFSLDDDPKKLWEFNQYQKNISQIPMGTCTVGSILGAIVNQLCQQKPQDSMKPEYYQKQKLTQKLSSLSLKAKMNSELSLAKAEENEINDLFQNSLLKLSIEHSIIETDYKHEFDHNLIEGDAKIKQSPYMIVKSQNDKMLYKAQQGAYKFGDGTAQDFLESKVLNNSQLPGVNNRQGMPEKATLKQSVRLSDQNQIIKFCNLPSAQTKRSLILRACEEMMKKTLKERDFEFLDRNYVEEYNDQNTLRQILATAIIQQRPEIQTEYFEMDDGLLISLYYKNPPGRLLRRQWTQPPLVFPNFSEWLNHLVTSVDGSQNNILNDLMKNRKHQFLDIQVDKVGAIKNNTKFMFPSDNSIIRVEKHQIGQKRMGESLIIKDNFIFGITENKNNYYQKVDGEDELCNRDSKKKQDRRCELWLQFENGVRMTVEMQDHLEANMGQLPPLKIVNWLKRKIDREIRLRKKLEEESDDIDNIISTDRQNQDYAPSVTTKNFEQTSNIEQSPKADSKMEQMNQTNSQFGGEKKTSIIDQDEQPGTRKKEKEEKAESEILEEEDPELLDGSIIFDGQNDLTKGAKLSFTFNDGLVVQVLPNGDVLQKIINEPQMPKNLTKGNNLVSNQQTIPGQEEIMRVITVNGDVIKHLDDGNFIIYMADGTITYSDKRRGIWYTISLAGVKRERKIKNRIIKDEHEKLNCQKKIDPETNAQLTIREDGLLNIVYVDSTQLTIMPDGTNILKKKRDNGEAGIVTIITKDKFAPVRIIYDPVKARARTIIGLGGTDALMGKDNIMERTNTGRISEVLLPDKTIVQSYFEKQELEGYNMFSLNMIHLVRRDDFSVVKVKQDGEVVLITANERAYLNEIGKQIEEFGTKDYDYFFELFGIANERRSGVYTCNLDQGKIWTEDEEGNFFIVYANGDSVEKMSVSFNLDQMVDGIENKEPESPRMLDGEFMEDECKFLPPPKSMAHPRLFYVRNDGTGCEFFNEEQTTHMFRTFHKQKQNQDLIQSQNLIYLENEECIKHVFIQKQNKQFNAQAFDVSHEFPKLPQSLEMVNQTVSIPTEPIVEHYTIKNVFQFKQMDQQMTNEFNQALNAYQELKDKQKKMEKELKIVEPHIITIAAAPMSEKEGKMRGSTVYSNMNQSNNFLSPTSDGGLSESFMLQNSISPKQRSPRGFKDLSRNLPVDQLKQQKLTEDISAQIQEDIMEDDVPLDPESGLQIYKNDMSLNILQKLQMRIIQERNIDLQSLKGDEFKPLKEFRKLENRSELLNNVYDFFDKKFENQIFSLNDNEQKQRNNLDSAQPSAMFLSISSQKEIM